MGVGLSQLAAMMLLLSGRSVALRVASGLPRARARAALSAVVRRAQSGGAGASGGDEEGAAKPKPKLLRIARTSKKAEQQQQQQQQGPAAAGPRRIEENGNFVTVRLGSDKDVQNAEMEDRLQDARKWVSKQLTDDEADMLNRAMGIEAEVLAAMNDEESSDSSPSKSGGGGGGGKNKNQAKGGKDGSSSSSRIRRLQELSSEEMRAAADLRGFLELNPYLCSGCGAPFQSKTPDAPGFLPPDKLQEHRKRSVVIRDKQEAVRILELAGVALGSAAAEELLREAALSDEVIAGVRALAGAGAGARDAAAAAAAAAAAEAEAEAEADAQEGSDPLDGLEIDLEELLAGLGGKGGEGGAGAGGEAGLAQGMAKQNARAPARAQAQGQGQGRGQGRAAAEDFGFINDLDAEIASGGAAKMVPLGAGSGAAAAAAAAAALRPRARQSAAATTTAVATDALLPPSPVPAASGAEPVCICQRCFRLQQYGQVEATLRPGWSSHELLTPARFEQLLGAVRETRAVVLCLVDLFDLQGSLLRNLKSIAGDNPIIVAANKLDLLPRDASSARLTGWVHAEIKRVCDLSSPKEADEDRFQQIRARGYRTVADAKQQESEAGVLRRSNVHLVSSQTGVGVSKLLRSVMTLAAEHGDKVYVLGAANVGKSSFINRLLDTSSGAGTGSGSGKKAGKKRSEVPLATVSNLPGTTLDFLKIRLPNGITVIDTPGLLNPGQLTAKLTTAELRQIVPSKPINAVTLRLQEGKCVLVGGLATVTLEEVRPSVRLSVCLSVCFACLPACLPARLLARSLLLLANVPIPLTHLTHPLTRRAAPSSSRFSCPTRSSCTPPTRSRPRPSWTSTWARCCRPPPRANAWQSWALP